MTALSAGVLDPRLERNDLWLATLDALPESVAVLDEVGTIVAVNRAWRDFALANGGSAESLGASYLSVCDQAAGEDPSAAAAGSAIRSLLTGAGNAFECVYPCHSPERERWFSMRAVLLGVSSSMLIVVTHHEITERRQAQQRVAEQIGERAAMEQQLLGARDVLVTVTHAMLDGLLVLDAGGRATFVNEAAERLLGWSRAELLGELVHERIHALDRDGMPRPAAERQFVPADGSGMAARVEDDVFQCCDGTLLPVAYSSAPYTRRTGERGWVVVFHDITEHLARELSAFTQLESLGWVSQIREALDEERLVLYAQPIVDVNSGETVQHELLVRMIGRDGEVIGPMAFLPAAEQHGLIGAIDRRVLELSMAYAAAGNRIEVNLSADSISDPGLFDFVKEQLAAHDVDPRLIVFEITETALIQNEAVAQEFIANVRSLDCEVALDDFGTGYGGFYYLKHLPVSLLKIDQEFVRDLGNEGSGVSRQVVRAVVALARGMGQRTVAEGVESLSTLGLLRELGVDYAQGYLFARPAPVDGVLSSVRKPRDA